MNYRLFLSILCFSCAVAALAGAKAAEYTYGPATGPRLIIAIPSDSKQESLITSLCSYFEKNSSRTRISIIVSDDDKASVQSNVDEDSTVLLFLPAKNDKTVITIGCRGKTTPPWLFKRAAEILDSKKITWNLAEYRMLLYRLGWTRENFHLAPWLNANVPAIQVETRNIPAEIEMADQLGMFITNGIPEERDAHYLVYRFQGKYSIASETFMVAALIVASAIILFFLFIFSFLFGERSDQHLRDLVHVWWLPFMYLAVNITALYTGQMLVTALIHFRFGNTDAWSLIPALTFISKVAISWFFITTVVALNQLIRFPEDSFIYGYIAAIVCFINIFVFGALNFSFSVLFLTVYLIAFVTYHVKHPVLQVIGIIALASPFVPYVFALFSGDATQMTSSFGPLYRGTDFWNVRLALLAMPFQLFMSRLFHTLGVFGRRHRFYFPVSPFAAFLVAIVAGSFVLFIPAWSANHPLMIKILQKVDSTGAHIETNSLARLPDLTIQSDHSIASAPNLPAKPERIIGLTATSQKFLERQLVSITVSPVISYDSIELEIEGDAGIPVHDASEPFELRNSGAVCAFVPEVNPGKEWTVNFSSSLGENLAAKVILHTHENPWGLVIPEKDISSEYILEVTRTLAVPKPETKAQ